MQGNARQNSVRCSCKCKVGSRFAMHSTSHEEQRMVAGCCVCLVGPSVRTQIRNTHTAIPQVLVST